MATTMQCSEDLEVQYTAVLGVLKDRGVSLEPGYYEGVADALAWVLGRNPIAPITQAHIPRPTPAQVMAEHSSAADVLYHRRPDDRSRGWVGGVEHGLLWAAGGTSDSPVAGPVKLRATSVIRAEIDSLKKILTDGFCNEITQESIAAGVRVLEWVAGDETTAPLSGRVADQAPGVESLEAEADFVDDVREGDDPPSGVSWTFVAGVDHTLRWVMCLTDSSV